MRDGELPRMGGSVTDRQTGMEGEREKRVRSVIEEYVKRYRA